MADIDMEAANKIRISMGLQPLPVPGAPVFKEPANDGLAEEEAASTLETREAAAYDNFQKLQQEEQEKQKRLAKKAALKKARDAAQRDLKLSGKGLGEVDDDLDAAAWLRQQGKRQKKIKTAEEKQEEELRRKRAEAQYTSADLAGLKVGHEFEQFETGEEQILTLKDAEIGEETEEDELEDLNLRDKERLQERLESKKRKLPYDVHASAEGNASLLGQYDEEIHGKKRSRFTLNDTGYSKLLDSRADDALENGAKGMVINLDILKDDKPTSDYLDLSEIKIKKPKKSKKKSTRKKSSFDDPFPDLPAPTGAEDLPDIEMRTRPTEKRNIDDMNFVDDDDLQTRLARQRRQALKSKKKLKPEDIAKQLQDEEASAMNGVEQDEDIGLVLDETSEFVANIQPNLDEARGRTRVQPKSPEGKEPHSHSADAEDDSDVEMKESDFKEEISPQDISDAERDGPSASNEEASKTGLAEEGSLSQGLGSTLAMLRQRHLIDDEDHGQLNSEFRSYQKFLAEKKKRETDAEVKARQQRERDRQSGRLDRMSVREREEYARQINTQREQLQSRELANHFSKNYMPTIELKYVDEFGRKMTPKEAFKHMSHQFHGKGSGKQKHEKMLKKIEAEKKREAMSALDSSQHSGMNSAMGDKAKKSRQAGVRLQ